MSFFQLLISKFHFYVTNSLQTRRSGVASGKKFCEGNVNWGAREREERAACALKCVLRIYKGFLRVLKCVRLGVLSNFKVTWAYLIVFNRMNLFSLNCFLYNSWRVIITFWFAANWSYLPFIPAPLDMGGIFYQDILLFYLYYYILWFIFVV